MNCETVSERLPELLAGSLNRAQELEVLAHLASCGECRKELALWAKVAEAAQQESAPMPSELFRAVREELLGHPALSVADSLKLARNALELTRSACKLVFSTLGR